MLLFAVEAGLDTSAYKELKLSVVEAVATIQDFVDASNGKLTIEKKPISTNVSVTLPGSATAMLALFDTKNGLTINFKLGKNQDLSKQLADFISSKTVKVSVFNKSIPGIHDDLFKSLVTYLEEIDCSIEQHDSAVQMQLNITRGVNVLVVHWYKQTYKLLIQGKTSNLLDDLLIWVSDNVIIDSKEIVELLFETFESLTSQKITFPDSLIDGNLAKRIGTAYGNRRIITEHEKKWLKTSCYLCNLEIELPEYYAAVSSALKVIEGLLKRICTSKLGIASFGKYGGFDQFEGKTYCLKPTFKSILKDSNAIKCLEELYEFIATKRNSYQHNNGIAPALVTTRDIAKDVFDEIVKLIANVEVNARVLL